MHDPQSSTKDHAERLAGFPHRRFSGQGQTLVRQRGEDWFMGYLETEV